ncbi:NAD(P)H-dependent oxidoreductase [Paenibacillus doosanensis]|uniref:NADPH azoreductase n=1 Tax=Paenibacillus konkukensis TaxID=2020716 RepID=A0ABY4RQQ0_9BACL|nr:MULTISPECIES: NADPH-dependent FMN reductase [Paenibacillus]MCS7464573.1 NAD(P)H-dependent oxidoreductase [Paenibacillus doosanensis]UQZ84841.1 NADPH azoreductase [Paenibacillus konkukensis]
MTNIVTISGSLRKQSWNTALLKACAALAPEGMKLSLYEGIGDLPHFNPEMDGDEAVAAVVSWREALRAADAVLVCTPEYAAGVPGSLKNALDWIVSSGEFLGKPTAVISASPSAAGGEKAHASLLLTLNIMSARIPDGASLRIPFISKKLDAQGGLTDPDMEKDLRLLLNALSDAVSSPQ